MRTYYFYFGALGFILFEIARVYFIMPLPGSQEMQSLDLAYFLHQWKWVFRSLFLAFLMLGFWRTFQKKKWLTALILTIAVFIVYQNNWKMSADKMFLQPGYLNFADSRENMVDLKRIVIGIHHEGKSKAYPIQFLGYHHQVIDQIADKKIMVTYCTVCRTGRIFKPIIHGKEEVFRLVGMDHFNAMFEDRSTKSWWRQATGEAVAGPLKGMKLAEMDYSQMTLEQWLQKYPDSQIMQPDSDFTIKYDSMSNFERGKFYGKLTIRDTHSWQDKSWIIGISLQGISKAYDWNELCRERIIHDSIENIPLVIALSEDQHSFVVYQRKHKHQILKMKGDSLVSEYERYDFFGNSGDSNSNNLRSINASQEYWHSWKYFHPNTLQFYFTEIRER